ncbi:MAG: phosphoribosyl-ATP diphosphatase [Sphingomonadaceae bacterium]|nr:phosphoribosyl-ATP diphosphatase [Sphingomonadaceae bacterium]
MPNTLARLEATIRGRRGVDPAGSYTASLFDEGRAAIARKLGEEALETVIAALGDDRDALTCEAADLLYHLLVLLADAGIPLADILAELDRREGVSGLDEKAVRTKT